MNDKAIAQEEFERRGKPKMTQQESGRLGGLATRRNQGLEHFKRAGHLGGVSLKARYGPAYFQILGRKGGRPRKNEAANAPQIESKDESGRTLKDIQKVQEAAVRPPVEVSSILKGNVASAFDLLAGEIDIAVHGIREASAAAIREGDDERALVLLHQVKSLQLLAGDVHALHQRWAEAFPSVPTTGQREPAAKPRKQRDTAWIAFPGWQAQRVREMADERSVSLEKLVLQALGLEEEKPPRPEERKPPTVGPPILSCGSAKGQMLDSKRLKVFAGSIVRGRETDGIPSRIKIREERMKLVESGVLIPDGDDFRFSDDHDFPSPSTAACVVLGVSANGNTAWKDEHGRTLKDIQEGRPSGD